MSTLSSTKILSSVANSFKLELFENVNSDEDSDDYTKYNRVKFSPTATEQVESEMNDSSTASSMKSTSNSNNNTNSNNISNSKSISFSFKSKSNELLKKIQKRNTFASHPKTTSEIDSPTGGNGDGGGGGGGKCGLAENSNSTNYATDAKLYKSKSAHVKKVSVEQSLTLKSINLDEETCSGTLQSNNNNTNINSRKSNINYIKVSPRVKSIAAFSTRNLFRNFETSSPNEKTSESTHTNTNALNASDQAWVF
jgi:hypothetical protein